MTDPFANIADDTWASAPLRVRRTLARGVKEAPRASEAQIQRGIVNMVRRNYPQAWVAHIPNELGRKPGRHELLQRKRNGVSAGAPDLVTTWPGGVVVWLEVKTAEGDTSEAQDGVIARLRRQGQHVAVVRDVAEAEAAFRAAGVLRPRNADARPAATGTGV